MQQNQQNDVCPANTQIILRIRPVWAEFSLSWSLLDLTLEFLPVGEAIKI